MHCDIKVWKKKCEIETPYEHWETLVRGEPHQKMHGNMSFRKVASKTERKYQVLTDHTNKSIKISASN